VVGAVFDFGSCYKIIVLTCYLLLYVEVSQ